VLSSSQSIPKVYVDKKCLICDAMLFKPQHQRVLVC
jgi:hypothetical protein